VIEEPLDSKNLFGWGASTAPWVTAQSPYVLDDQSLNSTIRVKAIDKAGNEFIATLVPEEGKRSMSFANKIIIGVSIVVAVLLVIIIALSIVWYRRRKTQVPAEDAVIVEPKK
jgi:subtilase family serine protease